MSNFGLYMIGIVLVVGALAYGASLLGMDSIWIGILAIAFIGLGVMSGVARTRRREPPQGA